jgi:serine/threonine protein kinase
MCILGAVLTDKAMVDPLTDYTWIGPGKHNAEHLETVSRLFMALAEGLGSLDEFYRNLNIASQGCPADCFFPDMRSYPGESGPVPIKYLSQLVPDQRSKTIYKGEASGKTIVVKFTDRYNAAAHELLAKANFAPQLLYSGHPDPELKRPIMVVMDLLEGRTAEETFTITPHHHLSCPENQSSLLEQVHKDVKDAIRVIHESGLVFGDLRAPNIMIVGGRAKLIDFDWCGPDGEETYPGDVNIRDRHDEDVEESIKWHAGVQRGGVMRKDHDLWMINQLFHLVQQEDVHF